MCRRRWNDAVLWHYRLCSRLGWGRKRNLLCLGNTVLPTQMPVGLHRQRATVLVPEPAGDGRDVHTAFDANRCEEMTKVVVRDAGHAYFFGGAIHRLLALPHEEHFSVWGLVRPRGAHIRK